MKQFVIGRILVVLALAGLALAPMSAAISVPIVAPQHAMVGMDLSADMDCCPEQQAPLQDCAKTCPFLAMCLTAFGALTAEDAKFTLLSLAVLSLRPGSEFALASLTSDPPNRPPRI